MSPKILLPAQGENAAIATKVKTAALCYDRVWSTTEDVVPESIRCWGGTHTERGPLGLAADFNIKTGHAPLAAVVGPEEKRFAMIQASTDSGLGVTLREVANSFSVAHGVTMNPIYDWVTHRDNAYQKGDRQTVIATLSNLQIVDENQLTWEQVTEFRSDRENQEKYRRFLHWLSVSLAGRSQALVDEEILQKLTDYEAALKKHGIRTVLGVLSVMFTAGLVIQEPSTFAFGNFIVFLTNALLNLRDNELNETSEVSWVYEVEKLTA